MNRTWRTRDSFLAAFLISAGWPVPVPEEDGNSTYFRFDNSEKLQDHASLWREWTGGTYSTAYKWTKQFTRKP